MTKESAGRSPDLMGMAGGIVAAYVSNNHVSVADLPTVIASVYGTLTGIGLDRVGAPAGEVVEQPTSAQIKGSIAHDALTSFIDGKAYKTLKRHLASNGLDPRGYRERYGLPDDYPMVAQSYAEQRSALAKAIGLGVPGGRAERKVSRSRKAA